MRLPGVLSVGTEGLRGLYLHLLPLARAVTVPQSLPVGVVVLSVGVGLVQPVGTELP